MTFGPGDGRRVWTRQSHAVPDRQKAAVPAAAKPGAPLLDRILAPANLAAAWEAVAANAGVAGTDEVGIRRFGRTWEEGATRLAEDVRGNRYQPGRLRVRFIPKRDGRPAAHQHPHGGRPVAATGDAAGAAAAFRPQVSFVFVWVSAETRGGAGGGRGDSLSRPRAALGGGGRY